MKIKFGKLARWAFNRLKERSTYVGGAAIAGALGAHALGAQLNQLGLIVPMILGTGLAAASTSAD